MGCCHPSSCFNNINEKKFSDNDLLTSPYRNENIFKNYKNNHSEDGIRSINIGNENDHQENLSDQSINSILIKDIDNFDYNIHSENILESINDIRNKPQKYLNKFKKFLKFKKNSILHLIDINNNQLDLFALVDPNYIISYLEKCPSLSPILWSESDFIQIYTQHITNDYIIMKIGIIFKNPIDTIFTLFLSDQEGLNKIFSNKYNLGVVYCDKKQNMTIIYFK